MLVRRVVNNELVDVLTVEDGEFGSVYAMKSSFFSNFPCYLYSSPPESPEKLNHYANKLMPIGKDVFIFNYDRGSKMVGVYGQLKEGDRFLARELAGHPGILEVATFSPKDNKNPDMPETGDAIEIQQRGYVLAEQVEPAKHEKQHWKRFKCPVFLRENLIADVKQNNLGDCFLLASALAILHRKNGDQFIKSMMIADGDYTIVRLFNPNTLQPCYIRVKNSIYHHDGENKVLHQAPWVHILEKAYMAFAFKSIGETAKVTIPAFREMFGDGGNPSFAMTILTGERAVTQKMHPAPSQGQPYPYPLSSDQLLRCVAAYYAEQQLGRLFADINAINDYLVKDNVKVLPEVIACLKQSKDLQAIIAEIDVIEKSHGTGLSIIPLLTFIANNVEADKQQDYLHDLIVYFKKFADLKLEGDSPIELTLETMREFVDLGKYLFLQMQQRGAALDEIFEYKGKVTNLQELVEYFQFLTNPPISFPDDYLQRLRKHAFDPANIPDATHDIALYSAKSLAIFEDIEKKLSNRKQNHAITGTTLPKFDEKVPGLRPNHVYSVVRTELDKRTGMRYVVVRNPWGHTGREYNHDLVPQPNNNNAVVENKRSAESRLVLSDFVKYFGSYSVGQFNTNQIEHIYSHPSQPTQQSFMKRHWGKILVGAVVVAALVIGGIFTFGAMPAITAGVIAGFAAAGAVVSPVLATSVALIVIGAVASGVGALLGAIAGKIQDVCKRRKYVAYAPLPTTAHEEASQQVVRRSSSTADLMDVFECGNTEQMSAEVTAVKSVVAAQQELAAPPVEENRKDKEDVNADALIPALK